jgi:sulfofructose kinase
MAELAKEGVATGLVARGHWATSFSSILVKPNGDRSVVNFREHPPLRRNSLDLSTVQPTTVLFDGHEPKLSESLLRWARTSGTPTILDAGSLHAGTEYLMGRVDYLVASHRFACECAGTREPAAAAATLNQIAPSVVITLGHSGLVWKAGDASGWLPGFPVEAVDSTGAGDAFHGAFALGVARGMSWNDLLIYANAVGALCCTKLGARAGLPVASQVDNLLRDGY